MSRRGRRRAAALLGAAGLAVVLVAWGPPGSGPARATGWDAVPARAPLTIAQVHYDGGGDWYANPSALPNLLAHIGAHTSLPVAERPAEVRLTDPGLRSYPYLYLTGHGNIRLSEAEVAALRAYLDDGGFLHADDNYGLDESFRREIGRVYPDAELVEVPFDHPIYHVVFDLPNGLPKVHEHDGLPAQGLGLFRRGRLVVFYSYQSDLGDGWEDPEVHDDPPSVRERALRMGVNLFVYAITQAVT